MQSLEIKHYTSAVRGMGVRTQGQMGSADLPGKMDEKLKSENTQKEQFLMLMLYFEWWVAAFAGVVISLEQDADLLWPR